MINHDKLKAIENGYLQYMPDYWNAECYKWKAIQHFQKYWDVEAFEFAEMLEQALGKTYNLLNSGFYYAKKMLLGFAKEDPNGVREIFRVLYDETQELSDRVERFTAYAEDRKLNHNESGWKNHFQDYHAISVYLWLRFPDKYYIYKYGELRPMALEIESDFVPKRNSSIENLIGSYRLCDEICAQISQNEEIINTFKKMLTSDCYADPQYKTLTSDIVFYVSRFYLSADASEDFDEKDPMLEGEEWSPSIKEYTPGFSSKDWLKLLNNREVIGPIWGGTLAAFYDAGGQASCSQIGETYGKKPMAISGYCTNLAKRIYKITSCPLSIGNEGKPRYWSILFQGKTAGPDVPGSYIWKLRPELIDALREFHIERFLWPKVDVQNVDVSIRLPYEEYNQEDFLSEVFMSSEHLEQLIGILKRKKNIILQGAPGVGKTFTAKRLAYVMMGQKDSDRIASVQFHQNYSYEDFVMGYKPDGADFSLQTGVFYEFCEKAREDPSNEYFFIIDEINRGNMNKIFGELLQLIEVDYRGETALLAYTHEPFSVPENLYLIGMMNTADRSLALIDYALRRRFSFFEMVPGFMSEGFREYSDKYIHNETFDALVSELINLNKAIVEDPALGKGFRIGHSYLCLRKGEEFSEEWLQSVVEYDIIPTIQEYWFDDPEKVTFWENNLRGIFNA